MCVCRILFESMEHITCCHLFLDCERLAGRERAHSTTQQRLLGREIYCATYRLEGSALFARPSLRRLRGGFAFAASTSASAARRGVPASLHAPAPLVGGVGHSRER